MLKSLALQYESQHGARDVEIRKFVNFCIRAGTTQKKRRKDAQGSNVKNLIALFNNSKSKTKTKRKKIGKKSLQKNARKVAVNKTSKSNLNQTNDRKVAVNKTSNSTSNILNEKIKYYQSQEHCNSLIADGLTFGGMVLRMCLILCQKSYFFHDFVQSEQHTALQHIDNYYVTNSREEFVDEDKVFPEYYYTTNGLNIKGAVKMKQVTNFKLEHHKNLASLLVYVKNSETIGFSIPVIGYMNNLRIHYCKDMQSSDKSTVIVYEGSLGGRRLAFIVIKGTSVRGDEWTSNMNARKVYLDHQKGVYVHGGFYNTGEHIMNYLENDLNILKENGMLLFITGHSRGGAAGHYLTYKVNGKYPKIQTITYTFGSPRVGNEGFAEEYKLRQTKSESVTYRVFHYRDPVPSLPLAQIKGRWTGYDYGELIYAAGFSHVENGICVEENKLKDGKLIVNVKNNKGLSVQSDAYNGEPEALISLSKNPAGYHFMKSSYLRLFFPRKYIPKFIDKNFYQTDFLCDLRFKGKLRHNGKIQNFKKSHENFMKTGEHIVDRVGFRPVPPPETEKSQRDHENKKKALNNIENLECKDATPVQCKVKKKCTLSQNTCFTNEQYKQLPFRFNVFKKYSKETQQYMDEYKKKHSMQNF